VGVGFKQALHLVPFFYLAHLSVMYCYICKSFDTRCA
jgi:hypothetical protein